MERSYIVGTVLELRTSRNNEDGIFQISSCCPVFVKFRQSNIASACTNYILHDSSITHKETGMKRVSRLGLTVE